MGKKIKWGILGSAHIATEHVIPAMLSCQYGEVYAIASRSTEKAQNIAEQFGIPEFYGSYEELLADKEVDAIYIPLPNHLHVQWAIKALEADKHVLVEKPVGLSSKEAERLLQETKKYPHLKVMEAFMYRHHPQWIKVKELVDQKAIGDIKTIQSSFSFFEDDPNSIVNSKEFGGGSLMDIGCYPISLSRLLFNSEPKSISSVIEYHPDFKVDVLASGILEFETGTSVFFSSTQLADNQQAQIFGTKGNIKFELPFNPPIDRPSKIWVTVGDDCQTIEFETCNQYTIQADLFALAIINNTLVPTPLEDSVKNMIVIEKLEESNLKGQRIPM
ncbi:Gfo/Idh/MocA family protein [Arenibacter algicola]|uniref:Glucose--fructose oxidoreductase n=1 Tax=Arenibacter algicola TaxID=616991 RepID=A0A221UTV8_9FLAO|nr:Gfo/Idh/MocA family oxidoreductase [Arenibacter algicola]ASO04767.1 glucose--fructose oxidoreductase [Arenibacter algicola]